ncbi:MAG: VanZ family protein [Thermoguttaceae bacterium]|nr:VanZ family protein [Thermoguttaceae bacterium]
MGVHFLLFGGLAVLVFAARWPRPVAPGWLLGLLAYALATETLQWWVPPRTVQWSDYLENVLGIAAGWCLYRIAQWRLGLAG